ncbi:MAG TPA: hypothetical protein VIM48_09495, partial [Chthoniobacterales bacterium]
PLVARRLPNVAPDLRRWGFRLPHTYPEVWIDTQCFDIRRERARQRALWSRWRAGLPASCRSLAEPPLLAAAAALDRPVAFSRLTLDAQMEILFQPAEETWRLCRRWNPLLCRWKPMAATGCLESAAWPAEAGRELSVEAWAARFLHTLDRTNDVSLASGASTRVQRTFTEQRLGSDFLFPLLMDAV